MKGSIVILDFGSQYTQLIARKIRELHIYAEIHPFSITLNQLKKLEPAGIILSGGPSSVYRKGAPRIKAALFEMGVPVLGICYGLQHICYSLGGKVSPSKEREFGYAAVSFKGKSALTDGIKQNSQVWMSHGDKVTELPKDFKAIAHTENSPYAIVAHKKLPIFGLQFHPEVHHTKQGKKLLQNFCQNICKLKKNWTMKSFAETKIEELRDIIGTEKVLLGLSGGVDSTVTAKLLHEAVGRQLTCVYVDNGLMRLGETEVVLKRFRDYFRVNLEIVRAEKSFLGALEGVEEPEEKRKIIGQVFLDEFAGRAKKIGHHEFFAQGTLYTDVIESVSVKGPSQTIKSHHNRVQGVLDLIEAGRVVEPLKELFKDEVRALGLELGIPKEMLFRHPFPGPGLAIRIMGEVNKKSLDLLRQSDAILLDELKANNYYSKIWQAFAVLLNVRSVGVMGDARTYEDVIALRMVESQDGMTADFARVPHELLSRIANRIINEVQGINRVVYDISSKPPATIEWE